MRRGGTGAAARSAGPQWLAGPAAASLQRLGRAGRCCEMKRNVTGLRNPDWRPDAGHASESSGVEATRQLDQGDAVWPPRLPGQSTELTAWGRCSRSSRPDAMHALANAGSVRWGLSGEGGGACFRGEGLEAWVWGAWRAWGGQLGRFWAGPGACNAGRCLQFRSWKGQALGQLPCQGLHRAKGPAGAAPGRTWAAGP